MIGGKNWAMPSLGVLTYLKNKKKSISQKVQIQKRVRKMDFGNDSAKFGGGAVRGVWGDSYSLQEQALLTTAAKGHGHQLTDSRSTSNWL